MSIDQQDKFRTSQEVPDQPHQTDNDKPDKRKFELSPSQVVGGALAAMTAAAIGARLGSAGTIIGAAAASVVAAVSGAIYTASVRHTQEKVRVILPARWKTGGSHATVQLVSDSSQANAAVAPAQQLARGDSSKPWHQRVRLPWKSAAIAALLTFGIAAVAITGLELVSGHALSGDDGTTTITEVSRRAPSDPPTSTKQDRTSKDNAPTATSGPAESERSTELPTAAPEETTSSRQAPSAAPTTSASAPASTPPASTPSSEPTG